MSEDSKAGEVQDLYAGFAGTYDEMMDAEIERPFYLDVFTALSAAIASTPGPVIDTSCGTGHMLQRLRDKYEADRPIQGVDLSPEMVALCRARLGAGVDVRVGDMRVLDHVASDSAAAVLSFFALHHLSAEDIAPTLAEWRRVLVPGGCLSLATWEGSGQVDYGENSDVVAFRYTRKQLAAWCEEAGLRVTQCDIVPFEDMGMDAVWMQAVPA